MVLVFALVLAPACAPADPAADRAAFLALACDDIRDTDLRDDCYVQAVRADPDREGELCPRVAKDWMVDECRFTAVDARRLVGEDALRACGAAGRFVRACHANAISREVTALPPMPESELTEAIGKIVRRYGRPEREVQDLVRRRIKAVGTGE